MTCAIIYSLIYYLFYYLLAISNYYRRMPKKYFAAAASEIEVYRHPSGVWWCKSPSVRDETLNILSFPRQCL